MGSGSQVVRVGSNWLLRVIFKPLMASGKEIIAGLGEFASKVMFGGVFGPNGNSTNTLQLGPFKLPSCGYCSRVSDGDPPKCGSLRPPAWFAEVKRRSRIRLLELDQREGWFGPDRWTLSPTGLATCRVV